MNEATTNTNPAAAGGPGGIAQSPLPTQYKPADYEPRIRERWEASGAFHPDPARVLSGERAPFCIFIPPPNVTGALHLGHALNNTLQDILTRAHRMRGFETLWMPGTDHAGIATQFVVERRLRQEGKLKGPLKDPEKNGGWTRDAFVAQIQSWKDEYEKRITNQLQAMGCSCDYERQRFTMDAQCAKAVYEAFFRFFQDNLIYRGKRLVNWDPALQTAVSDDECYDEEIDGQFYYLRYPLTKPVKLPDGETIDHITVATTRPETYLGDTAIAMNPQDPRAKALVGQEVRLPLVNRVIRIVADSYVVLPESMAMTQEAKDDPKAKFATGFLKVTPAHDENDHAVWERNKAAFSHQPSEGRINIFAPDASISDKHGWTDVGEAGIFLGLKREAARKKVVEEFKARGLLEDAKPYRHSVPHSDRSKAIIEPYLSDQWYLKVTDTSMAEAANEAVKSGKMEFHPARYAKTYETWHDNIRDWCISRQLWWGHQIPVWTKTSWTREEEATFITLMDAPTLAGEAAWEGATGDVTHVCLRNPNDRSLIDLLEKLGFARDPDVLDTWFSSALWPLSTLGWPDETALLKAYNPSTVLSTAREIITLWVSRMVMFNRYFHGEGAGRGPVPFRDVFIHAVVQDGNGKRMSKSAGNGVDPLDIIASHGADAMRFTLCQMTTQTQDVRMPVVKDAKTGQNTSPKFDLGRNLCNKLWNASRFAMQMLGDTGSTSGSALATQPLDANNLSLPDRWMLSRLATGLDAINGHLTRYEFSEYAQVCYDLLWRDFCDWYLEAIKPTIQSDARQQQVLRYTMDTLLRLLHPLVPFVTEAIWEHFRSKTQEPMLSTAKWPEVKGAHRDLKAEAEFESVRTLVAAIREVRAAQQVKPSRKITLHAPAQILTKLNPHAVLIRTLANVGTIDLTPPGNTANGPASVAFFFESSECRLSDLADQVDVGAERTRLEKTIAEAEKTVRTLESRLSNPGYADKAPPAMVQQTRDQLVKAKTDLETARGALAAVSAADGGKQGS